MTTPQEVLNNGARTGILFYDFDPTELTYQLPVNTIPARDHFVHVEFNTSASAGYAAAFFRDNAGVEEMAFQAIENTDGSLSDQLTLYYETAAQRDAHRGTVENRLATFSNAARHAIAGGHLPQALVNPVRFVTEQDFLDAAAKYRTLYKNDPQKQPLIAIDSVLEVFNNVVARPHKGEITRADYGFVGQELVLGVRLKGSCGGSNGVACPASTFTVNHGLQSMLQTYAGNLVDRLVIRG